MTAFRFGRSTVRGVMFLPSLDVIGSDKLDMNRARRGIFLEHAAMEFIFAWPRVAIDDAKIVDVQTGFLVGIDFDVTKAGVGRIVGQRFAAAGQKIASGQLARKLRCIDQFQSRRGGLFEQSRFRFDPDRVHPQVRGQQRDQSKTAAPFEETVLDFIGPPNITADVIDHIADVNKIGGDVLFDRRGVPSILKRFDVAAKFGDP